MSDRRCPQCEHRLEQPATVCPQCGAALPPAADDDVRRTARLDATVEFDQPASPPPEIGKTIDTGRGQLTVEFGLDEGGTSGQAGNLPSPDDIHRTLPNVQQTVAFDPATPPSDPMPPPPKRPTVHGRQASPTVDLTNSGSVGVSELGRPDLLHTFDADDLTASQAQRLARLWDADSEGTDNPRLTVRGRESRPIGTRSSLVIRSRLVARTSGLPEVSADYELLDLLGEGGMGVVYLARQASIDRTVALKMLKADAATDPAQQHKFVSEAVVTGDLEHPNIVPMYDLGTNDQGALFYVMKRVQGTPWSAVIADKSTSENLEIWMKVADAVAFAHSRGVVHRDLKPENVMLGDFGEVLVMDWGLAYSTPQFRKASSITQTHSMGGTPAYMAPEMALGPLTAIGPASDVYLLGAILYEIVSGYPPHTGSNISQCLRSAARNEIRPTRKSGELLDIALHAMATLPADRFASVPDLQAAIRQFQSHSESIVLAERAEADLQQARANGDYETYSRAMFGFQEAYALWEGNARAAVGISQARLAYADSARDKGDFDLAASLLDDSDPAHAELAVQVRRAQHERDVRQHRLRNVRRLAAALAAAILLLVTAGYVQIRAERDRAVVAEGRARDAESQALAAADQALAAEAQAREAARKALDAEAVARAAETQARSAEAQARQSADEARRDRDLARQAKEAEEYEAYVARIGLAAAKIDENAFGSARRLLDECPPALRGWEWGRLRYLCQRHQTEFAAKAPVASVAWSPDRRQIALASWDGRAQVVDAATGDTQLELAHDAPFIHAVAYSPDGTLLATGGDDPEAYAALWDAATGQRRLVLSGHTDGVLSLCFSPDGQRLLTTSRDHTARLWDTRDGRLLDTLAGHTWWVWDAAFAPDGQTVVTVGQDGLAIVWDAADQSAGAERGLRMFTGHDGPVFAVAVSPDGQTAATAGYDERVLLWRLNDIGPFDFRQALSAEASTAPPFTTLAGHTAAVHALSFSADGRRLLSGSHDNTLKLWELATGKPAVTLRGHAGRVSACQLSADGQQALSGSHDQTAKIWQVASYQEQRVLPQQVLSGHDDAVLSAAFSTDGQRVITSSRDRSAIVWDAATGQPHLRLEEGHAFLATTALFMPDGRHVATAAVDNTARIWEVATGAERHRLEGAGRAAALARSPDGRLLATGSDRRTAIIWDAATGQRVAELPELKTEVTAVAFSPDGGQLATGETSGRLTIWDWANSRPLAGADFHSRKISGVAFLPDGQHLLSASLDNTVARWNFVTGQEDTSRLLKHPDTVLAMALSPDAAHVATACQDGAARIWNLADGQLLATPLAAERRISSVAWSPGGRWLLGVSSEQRAVHLWDLVNRAEHTAGGQGDEAVPFLSRQELGSLVWAAAFAPDDNAVLIVGGNSARLWDRAARRVRQTFSPSGVVAAARFAPDGATAATASWDGSVRIWNTDTGQSLRKLAGGHAGYVHDLAFSPDGQWLVTAGDDRQAIVWRVATGEIAQRLVGHDAAVRAVAYSPDGQRIATASSDHTARVWDAHTGQPIRTLRGHEWDVLCCAFSPDGELLATGGGDDTARIWNVGDGQSRLVLAGHSSDVVGVAFSPDGRRLLTGSDDSLAKVWDTRAGSELLTLRGHAQELTGVAFAPDGLSTLTTSRDGTAILWLAVPFQAARAAANQ